MIDIPMLEPHCNSWVVSRKLDGSVIGEFFSHEVVARFNPATTTVETAAAYLARINLKIRSENA